MHIASPLATVEIRLSECLASIDDAITTIDANPDEFSEKLRVELGIRDHLPGFIARKLGQNPVYDKDMLYPFSMESVPLEDQRALNLMGIFRIGKQIAKG